MNGESLPLFPLEVVLFPGSALPLHIFEERYRTLVAECRERGTLFGVNLFNGGTIAPVGCSAGLTSVLREYDDGRLDIVVEGRRRYALLGYDTEVAPYIVGEVEYLDDLIEITDETLARETIDLYNTLIAMVYGDRVPRQVFDPARTDMSFVLAQKAGMDLAQRQGILALSSENARLQLLHTYLQGVIPKLTTLGQMEKVIRSDGYL